MQSGSVNCLGSSPMFSHDWGVGTVLEQMTEGDTLVYADLPVCILKGLVQ